MECKFCAFRHVSEHDNYCAQCGYPQRWPDRDPSKWTQVKAPESLVTIATDWYNGQWSGLYSVASTGKIFASKASDIVSELRAVRRGLDGLDPEQETFRRHIAAIDFLADQLPDEE